MKTKTTLRVLSLVMALAMILLTLPTTVLTASAAAPQSYTDISTDSTASVSGNGKYFRFIPTVGGTYAFYSTNNSGDPKGYLLDSAGNQLAWSDDYSGRNYRIEYRCEAIWSPL